MGLPRQTTRQELVRKFRALGWIGPISGGKHAFMKNGPRKVHIPNPHGAETIHGSLLKEILRQAEIEEDDWSRA
ncbi:MAG TPA: type II toxin-antitoxin system HicA family toxin [Methylomirabilota bacterium]|nr:type II toxin-antitoxin system HicA family toxin [Methylomirabilota bacterium]